MSFGFLPRGDIPAILNIPTRPFGTIPRDYWWVRARRARGSICKPVLCSLSECQLMEEYKHDSKGTAHRACFLQSVYAHSMVHLEACPHPAYQTAVRTASLTFGTTCKAMLLNIAFSAVYTHDRRYVLVCGAACFGRSS